MSFTRGLVQRVSRNFARPDTIGLAISPEGSGMQGAAARPGESTVAANIPHAPAVAAREYSPSPPPIPPLSPLRTQSNFNFFPPHHQQQHSQPQDQQHKPALTLDIPPPKPTQPNRSSTISDNRIPFGGGRDSVVTEFAEDGETSAGPGSAQIWRPPNTDPQSSTTYYVADRWGNWVLGRTETETTGPDEQIAELPTPMSKTVAERRREEAGQERAVPESRAVTAAVRDLSSPMLPSPTTTTTTNAGGLRVHQARDTTGRQTIRQVPPDSGRLPVNSRSSSVYSSFSMNFSLPQTVQPGPENPMPTANTAAAAAARKKQPSPNPESYYSGAGGGGGGGRPLPARDLTSRPRRGSSSGSGTRGRTDTMMSQDSTTTIASSIGSEVGVDSFPTPARQSAAPEQQQQGSLSPVVESPGRSPVSYPKIPRPRSNAPGVNSNDNKKNISGVQGRKPLQNPTLRVVNASQPSDSPVLGIVDSQKPVQVGTVQAASPVQAHISYYNPAKRQSMNPNPNRNPGHVRSGSPETIGGASSSLGQTQLQQPSSGPPDLRDTTRRPPLHSFQQRINNRSQLPSQSHYGPMSIYNAYARPESYQPQEPLPMPLGYHQQQQQYHHHHYQQQQQQQHYQQQQQQQQHHQYQQQQQQQQHQNQNQYQYQQYPTTFSPSPPSASASPSPSPSNSSLLAKRLGTERAAAFQVTAPVENPHNSSQARWKRHSSSLGSTVEMGPDGMVVPPVPQPLVVRKIGGGRREDYGRGDGGGGGGGSGVRKQEADVPLPATPGWKPQLTPKRKGSDLFLSVQ